MVWTQAPRQEQTLSDFFRFPHTPHLAWLGQEIPRADKVMTPEEARELLHVPVVIEEKLDGANLGLSLGTEGIRAQNRGRYLERPFAGQFARLADWLTLHEDALGAVLATDRSCLANGVLHATRCTTTTCQIGSSPSISMTSADRRFGATNAATHSAPRSA